MYKKTIFCVLLFLAFCGCTSTTYEDDIITLGESSDESATSVIELTESDSDVDIIEYTDEDKIIAQWMSNSLTDSEEFDDISDYRYYARALDLDMDFFFRRICGKYFTIPIQLIATEKSKTNAHI